MGAEYMGDKFSVVTYLAQFYHLFNTADSNISPNVSLHLGTSSESESEAATPLGTPTSEKKNFSASEKQGFDRNDLIERYGEEIFQNNKNNKIEQDPQEDEGVDVTMRGKSTPTYPKRTGGVASMCKEFEVRARIVEK